MERSKGKCDHDNPNLTDQNSTPIRYPQVCAVPAFPSMGADSSIYITSVTKETKSQSKNEKLKVFKALVLSSSWGEEAHLRIFKVAANGQRDAKRLVSAIICCFDTEEIEAISSNAHTIGEGIEDQVEIFDVFESRCDIPGHAWTREEIQGNDLDKLIATAVEELEAVEQ